MSDVPKLTSSSASVTAPSDDQDFRVGRLFVNDGYIRIQGGSPVLDLVETDRDGATARIGYVAGRLQITPDHVQPPSVGNPSIEFQVGTTDVRVHENGLLIAPGVTSGFATEMLDVRGNATFDALVDTTIAAGNTHENVGATFNVMDYIGLQTGGRAQLAFIADHDADSQTPAIVTAGVHAAVTAFYASGGSGILYFPPGVYHMADDLFAGDVGDGDSFAKKVYDGLGNSPHGQDRGLALAAQGATLYYHPATYAPTTTGAGEEWMDRVAVRYEPSGPGKPGSGISGTLPKLYWGGADLTDWDLCPTGYKLCYLNLTDLDFQSSSPRGDEVWPGDGVQIIASNNSQIYNIRAKAGHDPLPLDTRVCGSQAFNVVNDGGGNAGRRLVDSTGSGVFAIPTGQASTYWDGMLLLLSSDANPDARMTLVKIDTRVDDDTVDLDASMAAPQNATGINVGSQTATAATTAGSNVITMNHPILTPSMEGRLVHIAGCYRDSWASDAFGIMSGYIKHGSVSVNGDSFEMVDKDGAAANVKYTTSASQLHLSFGVSLSVPAGYDDGTSNDDLSIYGLFSEKATSGILLQNCSGVQISGFKAHGRGGGSSLVETDFSRASGCLIFDTCNHITVSNGTLSFASHIDVASEATALIKLFGNRNIARINSLEVFGIADRFNIVSEFGAKTDDHHVIFGGGKMQDDKWNDAANTHAICSASGLDGRTASTVVASISPFVPNGQAVSGAVPDIMASVKW